MVAIIFAVLIIVGIVFSLLTGNVVSLNDTILTSANEGLKMMLDLLPIIVLWTGIMKIAEDSGMLKKIAKFLYPALSKLFPSVPKDNDALGYIASNIAANAMGLGSAATPFGLKAMQELQKLNKEKDTATEPMITFLILNTSGVTIVPTTTIALRLMHGSVNPESIIVSSLIATFCSSLAGLLLDYFIRRKNNGI
jgi:spore maturation protein A